MKKGKVDIKTPQGALEKFSQLMGRIKKNEGNERNNILRAALMMAKAMVIVEEGKSVHEILGEVQKRIRPIKQKSQRHLFWLRLYDCREARINPAEYNSQRRLEVASLGMLENCARWNLRQSIEAGVSPGMLVARLGNLAEGDIAHGGECLEAWAKQGSAHDQWVLQKIFVKHAKHLCRSRKVVGANVWKLIQHWSERTTGQMELPIDLANCPAREPLCSAWWREWGVRR